MKRRYGERDFRRAVKYFWEAMKLGNVDAAYWMGVMFHEGDGVLESDTSRKAVMLKLFEKWAMDTVRVMALAKI